MKHLIAVFLLCIQSFHIAAETVPANANLTTSQELISFIKDIEEIRLKPYRGVSGKWLIGYGHLLGNTPGSMITEKKATELLIQDLEYSENTVKRLVKTNLAQHEFDALVSLTFNIGSGAFAKSTVLKKINRGDKQGAAEAFLMWNRAGGRKNKHLVQRRIFEKDFFLDKRS